MLLAATAAFALEATRDLSQFGCQTWNRQNGLPINGVRCITQSADGYLWLGSVKGIVRFDGIEFTPFTFTPANPRVWNDSVWTLVPARRGGFWVGLENSGWGRYENGVLNLVSRNGWGGDTQGEHSDTHTIVETHDGTLWIGGTNVAARLLPNGEYQTLDSNLSKPLHARAILEARDGSVWLGMVQQGLYHWRAGVLTEIPNTRDEAGLYYALVETPDGTIWAGTTKGLVAFSPEGRRLRTFLGDHEIRALVCDAHGVLWIGSDDGLYRLIGDTMQVRRKEDGLAGDTVTSIYVDREDTLWVGTPTGLSHLTDIKFPVYRLSPPPAPSMANAVTPARAGGVWVAHDRGVTHVDGSTQWLWPGPEAPVTWTKRVYEARNGDLYVLLPARTIVILSGGHEVARFEADDMVVGLEEDERSVIVSIAGKLARVSRAGLAPYEFKGEPPKFDWILNLLITRDGALWVATVSGLFRLQDGVVQHWGQDSGLSDLRVATLCEDSDGTVWIGQFNGLGRVRGDRIQMLGLRQGLFDSDIFALVEDDRGEMWADSGRGIFRVSRRELNACADGSVPTVNCVPYDGPDSVLSVEKGTQERVGAKSSDGRIWFCTPKGIVSIDPRHISANAVAPIVHLSHVVANGIDVRGTSAVVRPGRGELRFEFVGLSFAAPIRVRFRYQLVGYDNDWIDGGSQRLAVYNNLSPGTYIFRVAAANGDGIWSDHPESITITLQPHVHQTVWFRTLLALAIAAAVGGIFSLRIRQLKRRERTLTEQRHALEEEVGRRTLELQQRTVALEQEVEQRRRTQNELERVHQELMEISRQAGMAEVATGVLHNVGNVLNSVNVTATLMAKRMRASKVDGLTKVAAMLDEHGDNLAAFFANDRRAAQIPRYLKALADHLNGEHRVAIDELDGLCRHIDHIKEVVAMQQSYAKVAGVSEQVALTDIIEDAIGALFPAENSPVAIVREFGCRPQIDIDRYKLLQILMNLLQNAKRACVEASVADKQIKITTAQHGDFVRIGVCDNGVGIAPENAARLFSFGFTTSKTGHGFGLHSSAIAAKQMDGSLSATSEGLGKGATFTLELPLHPPAPKGVPLAAPAVVHE